MDETHSLNEKIEGKYTLYGVYINFEDELSERWGHDTQQVYRRNYTCVLAPRFNDNPLETYTLDDIKNILSDIRNSGWGKDDSRIYKAATIDKFLSNIRSIFALAKQKGICKENPLWGSELNLPDVVEAQSNENEFIKLRKSLRIEEEISVRKQVLEDSMQEGEKMGVALMFALGLRNSEACATNFGDIRSIPGHPDCYCLWVYKTTKRNQRKIKVSGKTRNADRLVPMTEKIARFFLNRKHTLEKMIENGVYVLDKRYHNAAELPIVCVGQDYQNRCSANELTKAAKIVLHEANLNSDVLGYIDASIGTDSVREKEATAYLFRRNFATHMHLLGLDEAEIQYVIGHDIEDPTETRNYFSNPEKLYPIKVKMDNRPLVSDCFPFEEPIQVSAKSTKKELRPIVKQTIQIESDVDTPITVRVFAQATEPVVSVQASIKASGFEEAVQGTAMTSSGDLAKGKVNIIGKYHYTYERKLKKKENQ